MILKNRAAGSRCLRSGGTRVELAQWMSRTLRLWMRLPQRRKWQEVVLANGWPHRMTTVDAVIGRQRIAQAAKNRDPDLASVRCLSGEFRQRGCGSRGGKQAGLTVDQRRQAPPCSPHGGDRRRISMMLFRLIRAGVEPAPGKKREKQGGLLSSAIPPGIYLATCGAQRAWVSRSVALPQVRIIQRHRGETRAGTRPCYQAARLRRCSTAAPREPAS